LFEGSQGMSRGEVDEWRGLTAAAGGTENCSSSRSFRARGNPRKTVLWGCAWMFQARRNGRGLDGPLRDGATLSNGEVLYATPGFAAPTSASPYGLASSAVLERKKRWAALHDVAVVARDWRHGPLFLGVFCTHLQGLEGRSGFQPRRGRIRAFGPCVCSLKGWQSGERKRGTLNDSASKTPARSCGGRGGRT